MDFRNEIVTLVPLPAGGTPAGYKIALEEALQTY